MLEDVTGPDSKMPCLLFLEDKYENAFKVLNEELDVKVMVMLMIMMVRTM